MRTTKRHFKRQTMALALVAGLGGHLLSGSLMAQDYLLQDTQRALNSPQIDVDGHYRQPREPLDQKRRQLERKNEEMVHERIEDIRVRQEQELAKSLQQAFNRGMQAMDGDSVSRRQSAPRVEQQAPSSFGMEENRVITGFGVTNASGDFVDFESKVDARLGFESQITDRLAVGLGIGYMTMTVKDMNPNNQLFSQYNTYQGYGAGYGYGYNNFQQPYGRDMDYRELSLAVDGKFYVLPHSRVRPFIGAGLGYKRTSLKYGNSQATVNPNINYGFGYQNQNQNMNASFGDEKHSANYVTASASLGSDVHFTSLIGARLLVSYTKGLTSGEGGDDFSQSMSEVYLRNVGRNIADADFISLGAGLIFSF